MNFTLKAFLIVILISMTCKSNCIAQKKDSLISKKEIKINYLDKIKINWIGGGLWHPRHFHKFKWMDPYSFDELKTFILI